VVGLETRCFETQTLRCAHASGCKEQHFCAHVTAIFKRNLHMAVAILDLCHR
jgi:hypothetical protein